MGHRAADYQILICQRAHLSGINGPQISPYIDLNGPQLSPYIDLNGLLIIAHIDCDELHIGPYTYFTASAQQSTISQLMGFKAHLLLVTADNELKDICLEDSPLFN